MVVTPTYSLNLIMFAGCSPHRAAIQIAAGNCLKDLGTIDLAPWHRRACDAPFLDQPTDGGAVQATGIPHITCESDFPHVVTWEKYGCGSLVPLVNILQMTKLVSVGMFIHPFWVGYDPAHHDDSPSNFKTASIDPPCKPSTDSVLGGHRTDFIDGVRGTPVICRFAPSTTASRRGRNPVPGLLCYTGRPQIVSDLWLQGNRHSNGKYNYSQIANLDQLISVIDHS